MIAIRTASNADAKSILEIYAPYIVNTSFTFETEVPTIEAFGDRINSYLENWPWLVCEIDGKIAGYAYASKYRERTGYQWCAECSVYVHDNYFRAGIAKALYTAIIEILKFQGYRNLYAVINLPNDQSVAFHEKMGFVFLVEYKNVGYKLGKWKTVGWWELQLNEYSPQPPPPLKFPSLDQKKLQVILEDAALLVKI